MSVELPKPSPQYDYTNEVETRRIIQAAFDEFLTKRANITLQPNQVLEMAGGYAAITSPDGSRFKIVVGDDGALSTTALPAL